VQHGKELLARLGCQDRHGHGRTRVPTTLAGEARRGRTGRLVKHSNHPARACGRAIEPTMARAIHRTPCQGRPTQGHHLFEAEFMLPWPFSEEAAAENDIAQLQHNMRVTNHGRGALIITGGGK
jgi:hypothetical protein